MPTSDRVHSPTPRRLADPSADALATTLDASPLPPHGGAANRVQVAQHLGRFVLLHQVGSGGMGTVFAAYDEKLDRRVALKLLHTTATNADEHMRVLREAQAMARVSDPGVVHVYDVGEINGQVFIAMEYIEGVTLAQWQKTAPSWKTILQLYQQAGRGLLAAHRTGLVHRDFKPDNVLLDSELRAHVADFGLACLYIRESPTSTAAEFAFDKLPSGALNTPLTAAGIITGTPGYMSPEQYRGAQVDSRSDQFSFCVSLYEALFKQLPFAGNTVAELAANTIAGRRRLPPPNSPVPSGIVDALGRGLAVEPAARFPSMSELLAALDSDESSPAHGRDSRRRIALTILVSCGLLATGVHNTSRALTPRDLVLLAAVAMSLLLVAIVSFRHALRRSPFSRRLMAMTVITVATMLTVRVLGWKLGLKAEQIFPLDNAVIAGLVAQTAYRYLSGFWWAVLGLGICVLFEVQHPQYSGAIYNWAYTVLPFIVMIAWMRATRQPTTHQES